MSVSFLRKGLDEPPLVTFSLPARVKHQKTYELNYNGQRIEDTEARGILTKLVSPPGSLDPSRHWLEYTMTIMIRAIVKNDEDFALFKEEETDEAGRHEAMLSMYLYTYLSDHNVALDEDEKDSTAQRFVWELEETPIWSEEAGIDDITVEALMDYHRQLMRMEQKDIEFPMYWTLNQCAPQLAWSQWRRLGEKKEKKA